MIVASGSSQVPAFGLGGALVATVVLLGGVGWLWRRTRRVRGVTTWMSAAGLTGLAATMLTLFVAGMQSYGGSVDTGGGEVANCSVWWMEAGLPSSQKAARGDFSASCRHDALAAIGPAVLVAVLIGLAVAVIVFGSLLFMGRRRVRRGPRVRDDRGTVVE